MNLTYLEVHLYLTIPITIVLWIINRPWLNYISWIKIMILLGLALIYTTPWDSYLLWTKTWSYPESAILGTIGYIPVEEYIFFFVQTLMVSFWSILVFRWSMPCLYLAETNPIKTKIIIWSSILCIPVILYFAPMTLQPSTPYFYLSCILVWSFPVIGFLWVGAGNYITKRFTQVILANVVPSVYLCWVDVIALRAGTWKINESATVGIMIMDKFPLEEGLFFFIVNFILVFGMCALDKSFEMLDTFPSLKDGNILLQLFKAFFTPEYQLEQQTIQDLYSISRTLKRASKSFWTASVIFPDGVRKDLSILYAFCRVTDDMVDNPSHNKAQKERNVKIIREFLEQLFPKHITNGTWKYSTSKLCNTELPSVNWKDFEKLLSDEEISAFRSIAKISNLLPAEPFYELCRGYDWDIENKVFESEQDLIEYSRNVASSVAVLCTTLFCHRTGNLPKGLRKDKHEKMINYARDIGVALQLTNIARDLITDSECLGRTYIPKCWLSKPKEELNAFKEIRNPISIGNVKLRNYSLRMLELADKFKSEGFKGIPMLPAELRGQVLCAIEIYTKIGDVIRNEVEFNRRASVGLWGKIITVLKCLYLPTWI